MSKTSDKDPVRFSSPYEQETTTPAVLGGQPVEHLVVNSKPGAKLQIDTLITTEEVRYFAARINALEADNKRLDDERLQALVQASDAQQRVGQLENELAEYQDKPEAFERLRELLRKERSMRKQDSKRFYEVCDERNAAQAELESAQREIIGLESWSLFEGGCVPASIQEASWWTWNNEDPKYHHALAVIRWGDKVAKKLFPIKEAIDK